MHRRACDLPSRLRRGGDKIRLFCGFIGLRGFARLKIGVTSRFNKKLAWEANVMNAKFKSTRAVLCLLGLLAAPNAALAAGTCLSSCDDRHLTCSSSGKSDEACLSGWHQCKVGCTNAVKPRPAAAHVTSAPTRIVKAAARS